MNTEAVRFLILVAVFAAVVLAAEVLISAARDSRGQFRAMNKRLELIAKGFSRDQVMTRLRRDSKSGLVLPGPLGGLQRQLEAGLTGAGLTITADTLLLYLLLAATGIFVIALIIAVMGGITLTFSRLFLLATFAFAVGFGVPVMVFSRIADNRRKKLGEQFPVALDVFVRGLRAGHPTASALDLLTSEMQDPIGSEFGLVVDEITYGADMRDALQNMADRCGIEEMHMFVVSLSVQSETGGNLAEILENLSTVIRERSSLALKVRALSSEGRMTALILTGLPVMAFTGLFLLNPRFYLDVSDDPAFMPAFVCLLILYAIGFVWIRKMIDLKV